MIGARRYLPFNDIAINLSNLTATDSYCKSNQFHKTLQQKTELCWRTCVTAWIKADPFFAAGTCWNEIHCTSCNFSFTAVRLCSVQPHFQCKLKSSSPALTAVLYLLQCCTYRDWRWFAYKVHCHRPSAPLSLKWPTPKCRKWPLLYFLRFILLWILNNNRTRWSILQRFGEGNEFGGTAGVFLCTMGGGTALQLV